MERYQIIIRLIYEKCEIFRLLTSRIIKHVLIYSYTHVLGIILFWWTRRPLEASVNVLYASACCIIHAPHHIIYSPKSAHVMQENTKEKIIVNVKTFFRQYAWLGWEFEITPKRTQSVTIDMRTQHGIEEQFIIAFFVCE